MPSNFELLRQIQDDAVSTSVPVAELLRRCLMLGARVHLPVLSDWVNYELNGYPNNVPVPEYRVLWGNAIGTFSGGWGSGMKNVPLPQGNLPEVYKHFARTNENRDPIATIEAVASGKSTVVYLPWPADLVARVSDQFFEGMNLMEARLVISRAAFLSAVETVRNRILNFALEAEPYIQPEAGATTQSPVQALTQIFNNNIYGSVSNLAQGNASVTQNAGIAAGDMAALMAELERLGIPEDDRTALQTAIREDGPPKDRKLGTKVSAWIGGIVSKSVSGILSTKLQAAAMLLPRLVEQYYNLPNLPL